MDERRLLKRISIDLEICGGRPCVKGHRIPVELLLDLLASGVTPEALRGPDYYPSLTLEDIRACLAFAAQSVRNEDIHFFEELTTSRQ